MKNRFGRRYIAHREFLDYAKSLDLFTDHPSDGLLEFLEKHGILPPAARIMFPPEIARRWHKDRYPGENVPAPIEGDTQRLAAANSLHGLVFQELWRKPEFYGERPHPLDEITPEHAPFITKEFDPSTFRPWKELRAVVAVRSGKEMGDGGQSARTCYHYWQIFPLATFLRSGLMILYDLEDKELFKELWDFKLSDQSRGKLHGTTNLEARHEFRKIMKNAPLFEAVAYFASYQDNALQKQIRDIDDATGRLPYRQQLEFGRRSREIARETRARFGLKLQQLLDFIRFQCELWCTAKNRSPAKLADEYARNIDATIALYRLLTRDSWDDLTAKVGMAGGYYKPILNVIFPDWLDMQRELAANSLKGWIVPAMAGLPTPFAVSDSDIDPFCDWIEQNGLFQLYWHFKRLLDLGFEDGPVSRAATAAETVSFASTVELMTNAILQDRGSPVRGQTLAPKVRQIVRTTAPNLDALLQELRKLTHTNTSTLRKRLAQIDRVKRGQSFAPVLRALLKLIVIRNEGTHLGLSGLDRKGLYDLIQALLLASLLLWKAR